MAITTVCPSCSRPIQGPDAAGGRKARCPECGGVIVFPAAPTDPAPGAGNAVHELAAAVAEVSPKSGAVRMEGTPSPKPSVARTNGTPSLTRAGVTTIERLAARASPYDRLRLVAAVMFVVGVVLGGLVFLAGLAALIVASMEGRPIYGVFGFVAALIVAGLFLLGARVITELLRWAADVGDRTRQIVHYLEESQGQNQNQNR
jgi:DNA-directed RNA polymerase subunit RPC12/RpoP